MLVKFKLNEASCIPLYIENTDGNKFSEDIYSHTVWRWNLIDDNENFIKKLFNEDSCNV